MLEDDFNDCLSKAIHGYGYSLSALAQLTGISEKRIIHCLNGKEDPAIIHSLAPHLQLDSEKLLDLKNYQPATRCVAGLNRVITPFGHLGVNAYIVNVGSTSIIFDTGTDTTPLLEFSPSPTELFITHGHNDHIAGVSEFSHCKTFLPQELTHGEQFTWPGIRLKVLDVSGHYTPARAYFLEGLATPICITGDAIFAGSIGKCLNPTEYTTALANIRDHLLSLPDDTILCPGHGPLTTVAQEKEHNPFF